MDTTPALPSCSGDNSAGVSQPSHVTHVTPATTREVFQWPQNIANALLEPDVVCRLQSWFLGRVHMYSDYSGYGSEMEAMRCGLRALTEKHGWSLPPDAVIFRRACDIDALPQKVLTALGQRTCQGRMCLFGDVVEHCAPAAVEYLRAAMPAENSSQEHAEAAFAAILQWLMENRAWALPAQQKQYCLVHKTCCYVSPMASWMLNAKTMLSKKRKAAEALVADDGAAGASADGPGPSTQRLASILSPGVNEDVVDIGKPGMDRPLCCNFAGVSCDGWSSMGSQKRFGHSSELPHAVWVVERRTRSEQGLEDLAFLECTQNYPIMEKLAAPLSCSRQVLHLKVSPADFGFPAVRTRVFGACLNLSTVTWLGPDNWQADFRDKFFRNCVASGQALFVAPDQERFREYEKLAATQKNYIAAATFPQLSDEQLVGSLLTPGQQQRVDKFLAARAGLESSAGDYLFDADHHLEARKMAGPLWPCMLTHGCILSAPRRGKLQVATGLEHFGAQGLHLFEATAQDNPISPLRPILQTLKIHQQKQLSGRGIHVAVLSAWMYYILSNTVPVWKSFPRTKSLSWENVDCEDDDDDDA